MPRPDAAAKRESAQQEGGDSLDVFDEASGKEKASSRPAAYCQRTSTNKSSTGSHVVEDGKIVTQYHEGNTTLPPAFKDLIAQEVVDSLNPNRLIFGKTPGDVKRILAKRTVDTSSPQKICLDSEEFLVSWLGESDSLYTAWVPKSWLERDGYAWGLLAAFAEKEEMYHANQCASQIQAAYRGRHGRRLVVEKRSCVDAANVKAAEERKRVKAQWEANAAERAHAQGPEIISKLYDYIQEKKIKVTDVFHKIDKDGSGVLDQEEFAMAVMMMGFEMVYNHEGDSRPLTAEQAALAFATIDEDGGGEIDSKEFITQLKVQKKKVHAQKQTLKKQSMKIERTLSSGGSVETPSDSPRASDVKPRTKVRARPRPLHKPVQHTWELGLRTALFS